MLQMIDKGAGRHVASATAEARIVWKRLDEQRFAAPFGQAGLRCQSPSRSKSRIGQEIDVLDVNDHGAEHCGRRLGTGELIDDDVVNEVAQRGHPAVMAVGSQITRTAQARDRDRVEQRLFALKLNRTPVVVKLPGRVDRPGR